MIATVYATANPPSTPAAVPSPSVTVLRRSKLVVGLGELHGVVGVVSVVGGVRADVERAWMPLQLLHGTVQRCERGCCSTGITYRRAYRLASLCDPCPAWPPRRLRAVRRYRADVSVEHCADVTVRRVPRRAPQGCGSRRWRRRGRGGSTTRPGSRSRWRAGPRRTAAAPAHTGSPDGRGAW